MGIRLMIIKLRKYNKIGELLIENRTTGSQAQVSYQDMVQEASVTRVAVCIRVKGDRDVNRAQGCIQLASESGSRTGTHVGTVEQLRSISMQ